MLPSGMILWPQRRCVLYPQNEIFASVLPARASDPYRDSHAEMKQRNQWAQERRTGGDFRARVSIGSTEQKAFGSRLWRAKRFACPSREW